MKKVISAVLLSQFLALSAANGAEMNEVIKLNELKYGVNTISVGTISVTYGEKIKLEPDVAQFSVTYLTEGATPNTASNQNVKNMTAFKAYLKSLGVSDSDITTLDYKNFERTEKTYTQKSEYNAELSVIFEMQTDSFYKVIKLLDQYGISNLKKDSYSEKYFFTIAANGASENAARTRVQELYEKLETPLKNSGFIRNLGVKEYDINKNDKDRASEEIKKYYSSNQIRIKLSNFENIGKIYAKAQELKMNVNNDLFYFVSDERKQKRIGEYESKLFEKLQERAKRLIGNKEYSLGAPSNLSISTVAADDSRYRNYRGYDQNYVTNSANAITQTQAAQTIDINPPSDYEIAITINGSFDITKDIKK
ncbi:MAG: SIMPL domain-containing protein [Helicobacteraceae bacterium]|jgi:uncharacterized protein YggE|nr:SIMPL domain-containing protein [Helicobacteraceae bacterium]